MSPSDQTTPAVSLPADDVVLEQLSEAERHELHELYTAASTTQARALDEAFRDALGVLPRLVRVPAKKILFG